MTRDALRIITGLLVVACSSAPDNASKVEGTGATPDPIAQAKPSDQAAAPEQPVAKTVLEWAGPAQRPRSLDHAIRGASYVVSGVLGDISDETGLLQTFIDETQSAVAEYELRRTSFVADGAVYATIVDTTNALYEARTGQALPPPALAEEIADVSDVKGPVAIRGADGQPHPTIQISPMYLNALPAPLQNFQPGARLVLLLEIPMIGMEPQTYRAYAALPFDGEQVDASSIEAGVIMPVDVFRAHVSAGLDEIREFYADVAKRQAEEEANPSPAEDAADADPSQAEPDSEPFAPAAK